MTARPWPRYPLLYEINTRVWLTELSARAGRAVTLDTVPGEELDRISRLGFHGVWLMGVWTTGPEAVAIARAGLLAEYRGALPDVSRGDVIGSPYAVSRYQVAPRLGGPKALASFREALAGRGVRLMLDFVPNHTAVDHWLVRDRPAVFIRGTERDLRREPQNFFRTAAGVVLAHGRDPYFPAWTDTAQVNYAGPAAREAMLAELSAIAAQCDGVRCDMAMLLLPEVLQRVWGPRLGPRPIMESFWPGAITTVRSRHPGFLFLAEAYWNLEGRLQQEGFDFTYDKTLYDLLRQADYRGVRRHLAADRRYQDHCARFVENHDEPRAVEAFGPAHARGAAALSFCGPGLKLFHEGQLEGRRVRIPVQLRRRPQESPDVETVRFYELLLELLSDPIFQEGAWSLRDVQPAGPGDASNECLVALAWDPRYLIVVNLSGTVARGRIPLPAASFSAGGRYVFRDRCDGRRYERDGGGRAGGWLKVELGAHQLHLLEVSSG